MASDSSSVLSLDERSTRNRRRVAVLLAGFGAAVFVVVTILLFWLVGIAVAAVVGIAAAVAWILTAWVRCEAVILDLSDVDVDVADEHTEARLFNVTGGLCAALGVAAPTLYVVDDGALNALAVGRDAHHASLVFTRGLLDELNLIELEAVAALLLYKVRCGDTGPESLVVPTFGALGVLSVRVDRIDWLSNLLAMPNRGVERLLAWLHPSRGEIDTDIAAVVATRYPPALASALDKMNGHSVITAAWPVTEHLWIAPPLALSSRRNVVRIHSPLSERVAVLQEL